MADTPDTAELRARLEEAEARAERLEARAEHAERLATLGRLLAGVVHEINNPLMAVTMYADSLASRLEEPGEREKAAAILEAGQRIQKLARELVSYVRPRKEPDLVLPLPELVEEGLRLCRSELKGSSARLERTDPPGDAPAPAVRGKRASLVQVVVALVANACAAGEGHKIRVGVAPGPGAREAVLTIADEGAGMASEVLARAFEPFFTTAPDVRLGLGLCTARAIVERHGGRIDLASEPGRGTTATVVLPVA